MPKEKKSVGTLLLGVDQQEQVNPLIGSANKKSRTVLTTIPESGSVMGRAWPTEYTFIVRCRRISKGADHPSIAQGESYE